MQRGISEITALGMIRFLLCLLLTAWGGAASASIVTETPKPLYDMDESELYQFLRKQNSMLDGFNLERLSMPKQVSEKIGNRQALVFVGQLLVEEDQRGPQALANYIKRFPQDMVAMYLAASQLIKLEKYREAELTLQTILQAQPDFHAATNLLGMMRVAQQQFTVAAQIFARVLLEDPNPNEQAAKYMAWLGMRNGNIAQAETALVLTVRKIPEPYTAVPSILLDLAELYRRQGKSAETIELLAPLKIEEPVNDLMREAIARSFEAATLAGQQDKATEMLPLVEKYVTFEPLPIKLSLARLYAQQGNFDRADTFIEQSKTENSGFELNRLLEKAKIEAVAQDFTRASETLEEYLSLTSPTPVSVWSNYMDVMILIGKGNIALRRLREVVEQSEDSGLQMLLVDSLLEAGDKLGAERTLNRVLSDQPRLASAWYRKGILLFDQGDNQGAAKAFESAVAAQPQFIDAWMALFGALHDHRVHNHASGMASADHADLMPLFDRAIEANPESIELLYEKGLTAYSGSELQSAKFAFDSAVARAPFHVPSVAMAAIVRADLNQFPEESLALAQRGESLSPQNPAIQDAVGWALVRTGDIEQGLTYLNRALQLMPGDEAVLAHLAEAYLQMGDVQQGLTYVRDALKGTLPDHTDAALREHLVKHDPQSRLSLQVNFINGFGVGESAGNILITQEEGGVRVVADVAGLPAGLNGMHFHEKPSCEAGLQQGERVAGLAAGGHYGHGHMMMDMGDMDMSSMTPEAHAMHMQMMKPKGDLPPLPIAADGTATDSVFGSNLTIEELRGRSLMIHQGPDVDGVSGPKIACAVIP